MKVGIDVSPIVYGTGVSIYTQNLVENLLQIDKENDYRLFFSSLRQKFPGLKADGYELRAKKLPPTLLDILWNKLHIIPVETFVGDVDVFHCSDWTQPPARNTKLVTTVHDLSFLHRPDTVHPKVLAAQKRRLKWVENEADAVIAVSEATKKEIVQLLDIPEDKITVIYEGVPRDVGNFQFSNFQFSKIKKKFKIENRYIMAVGSQAPRKNIENLIKAFQLLATRYQLPTTNLVIAGRYETEKNLPDGVITTGFLDRKELLALIKKAAVFVYPSLYEGFGLPILEAFSLETPVVTSNCSSMAEVGGDAVVLVEPESVDSIAEGINKVLKSKNLQKDLIAKGKTRLNDFSWQKTAQKTLEVYKQC
jgi:glycosyltransferase involved in cell wall biosynthesis